MSKHIIEMKNEHTNEIQRLNHTFESEKNRMACEFNNITNKFFELETRYAAYRTEKDLTEKDLNSEIEDLKMQISSLTTEKMRMEIENAEEMALREEEFERAMMLVRNELDECKATNIATLDRINR